MKSPGDQAQQCKLTHLRRVVSQDPPTPRSCIFSHLKSLVDRSNCAPAARHALGDFEDGHISIGEERYDSFYLLFTERISLSSHITEPLPTSNRHTSRLSGNLELRIGHISYPLFRKPQRLRCLLKATDKDSGRRF